MTTTKKKPVAKKKATPKKVYITVGIKELNGETNPTAFDGGEVFFNEKEAKEDIEDYWKGEGLLFEVSKVTAFGTEVRRVDKNIPINNMETTLTKINKSVREGEREYY
jgi:hypothetical protein